jgi:hypothetical protein
MKRINLIFIFDLAAGISGMQPLPAGLTSRLTGSANPNDVAELLERHPSHPIKAKIRTEKAHSI